MLYDIQLKFTSGGWLLHPPSIASLHLASSGASPSCWPCRMHTTWHAWLDTSTPWTHVISSHLHKHTHTTLKCDQTSTPNLTYQNSHLKSQGSHLAPQIPKPQNPNLKPHTTLLKANISHLRLQTSNPTSQRWSPQITSLIITPHTDSINLQVVVCAHKHHMWYPR